MNLFSLFIIAGMILWLVKPLQRKVTDEQVALYLEEHEPTLDWAILSAIIFPSDTR